MAVRDYSKGKIYKIVADTDEEYLPYVGSTIQGLAERMGGHRGAYKIWKKKGGKHIKSYDLFDKFGIENCKIILLEEYSCDSIMKLLMKEREWFDKIECCNKIKPFISNEEKIKHQKTYYEDNKKKILEKMKEHYETNKEEKIEYQKIYYEDHKEEILEKMKEHYEDHKEKILEKMKIYRNKHKEEFAEKRKETFTCNCGSISTIGNKARHERSLKHQNYLSSLKV